MIALFCTYVVGFSLVVLFVSSRMKAKHQLDIQKEDMVTGTIDTIQQFIDSIDTVAVYSGEPPLGIDAPVQGASLLCMLRGEDLGMAMVDGTIINTKHPVLPEEASFMCLLDQQGNRLLDILLTSPPIPDNIPGSTLIH